MHRPYHLQLEDLLAQMPTEEKPNLVLHVCCAPCASYVLDYLSPYFKISALFYNPNITTREEYEKRASELERLINALGVQSTVKILPNEYNPHTFTSWAAPLHDLPEGGKRCYLCYRMRLLAAACAARNEGARYFASTLSISPLKNARFINEIGEDIALKTGVSHLPSDFKKKGGYQKSIALSHKYNLYRQDYCGCIYSKQERDKKQHD